MLLCVLYLKRYIRDFVFDEWIIHALKYFGEGIFPGDLAALQMGTNFAFLLNDQIVCMIFLQFSSRHQTCRSSTNNYDIVLFHR